MPYGFLMLVGDGDSCADGRAAVPRSRIRIRDGRFCAKSVPPGRYRVRFFQDFIANEKDVTFPVFERGGDVLEALTVGERRVDLDLSYVPEAPVTGESALSGVLRFPDGAAADLERDPILLVVGVYDARSRATRHVWQWLAGPVRDGHAEFSVRVGSAPLADFQLYSRRWALDRLGAGDMGASILVGAPSDSGKLVVDVAAGRTLEGRVRLPGGSAYRPCVSAGEGGHALSVFLNDNLGLKGGSRVLHLSVDEEGRFLSDNLAPGLYNFHFPTVENLPWTVPMDVSRRMTEGEALGMTVDLAERADAAVAPAVRRASPSPRENGRSRTLLGAPSGAAYGEWAAYALSATRGLPFHMVQDSSGAWVWANRNAGGPPEAAVAPGRYDVYLLETTSLFRDPMIRVLGVRRGVELKTGERSTIEEPEESFPSGRAVFAGTVTLSKIPSIAQMRECRDKPCFQRLFGPRLDLFAADGRLAGSAFVAMDPRTSLFREQAVLSGDADKISRLLAGRRRAFAVSGLAPGRYTVRIEAFGYPARERTVILGEDHPARVDWDLDRLP